MKKRRVSDIREGCFESVECPVCSERVALSQPPDHSEYTPVGRCPGCDALVMGEFILMDSRGYSWMHVSVLNQRGYALYRSGTAPVEAT